MLGARSPLTPWSTANRIAAEGGPSSLLRLSADCPRATCPPATARSSRHARTRRRGARHSDGELLPERWMVRVDREAIAQDTDRFVDTPKRRQDEAEVVV